MTVILTILTAALSVGVLIGYTLAEQLLETRTRRQAAEQRWLNSQWQALASEWRELELAQHEDAERGESEPRQSTVY